MAMLRMSAMKKNVASKPAFRENTFQRNGFKESNFKESKLKETGLNNEAKIQNEYAKATKETLTERLQLNLPEASREHLNKIKGNITEKFQTHILKNKNGVSLRVNMG